MSHPALQFDPEVIGIINGKPVYRIAGGSAMVHDEVTPKDTDVELDEGDDDDDTRNDDDDDDDDTRQPEDTVSKAEHERIKAALRNERRERKKAQREFDERVQRLSSESTEDTQVEAEKARIDERNKRDSYWVGEIVHARAMAEFAAQGATSRNAERLARMVNLKAIEYDEKEREFDGLEEEIEAIMSENPEFFRAKGDDDDRGGRRSTAVARPRVDGASRGQQGGSRGGRQRLTSAQKLAAQALGKSPRRQR